MRRRLLIAVAALVGLLGSLVTAVLPAYAVYDGVESSTLDGQVQFRIKGRYACAGTLIDVRWVLTAKHCVEINGATPDNSVIIIGSRELDQGTVRGIDRFILHGTMDAVLLELDEPAPNPEHVIGYSRQVPVVGANMAIRGWGYYRRGSLESSPTLRVATMRLADDNYDPGNGVPGTGMLLTSIGAGVTAPGDSGAGVYLLGRIYGVLRAGNGTSSSDALKTASIADWIQQNSGVSPEGALPDLRGANLRIMPLGDSITVGVGSSHKAGYRLPLWNKLSGNTVDLVGSSRSGQVPDPDHEGESGAVIDRIADNAKRSLPSRPNVVTLHAGTNDMDRPFNPDTAPDRMAKLIDQITEAAPDATVVVASLVPARNSATQARIDRFNGELLKIVNRRQLAGKHVMLVGTEVTTADVPDGLHPNDTGYAKLADAFYWGILSANAAGWIKSPVNPGSGTCTDTAGRWVDRGQVASGVASRDKVRFADIDGDGRDDYLVVDDKGAVHAYWNKGGDRPDGNGGTIPGWIDGGRIASGTSPTDDEKIQFADINGDGKDDYLKVNVDTGAVHAWFSAGGDRGDTPGWIDAGQVASGVDASGITHFADIDGDRRDDYAVVDAKSGAVRVWWNKGGDRPDGDGGTIPGWIDGGQIASGVSDGRRVLFADVNCDTKDDYLVQNSQTGALRAWLSAGGDRGDTPGWIERGQIASGVGDPDHLVLADLDGDGRDDYLLVGDNGAVRAWINLGGDPA
ncbi:GDSL-type esterase/lipase family protein [Nonomuraea lactucae]|uniref:GDSL-type esterase/lipase family protein n=1 Tax=Nonomuraea lactucae TaxID=2249762 RepID=UPI0013B465C6|nr:GDSL-type esterase/lipase family protein [Nonomuraea lactucae]